MAATHGLLTGKPGVCISTLGPGALNLITGAAYAHLGAMAHGDEHRPEGYHGQPPGPTPDRRHRRGREADHQAPPADRQRRHHPTKLHLQAEGHGRPITAVLTGGGGHEENALWGRLGPTTPGRFPRGWVGLPGGPGGGGGTGGRGGGRALWRP